MKIFLLDSDNLWADMYENTLRIAAKRLSEKKKVQTTWHAYTLGTYYTRHGCFLRHGIAKFGNVRANITPENPPAIAIRIY